jgi:phage head maturation protease
MTAQFRSAFTPTTINDADRTVEVLASAGAGVIRTDYDGPFEERLDVSPAAVDLARVHGMPLLDTHRQDGLDRVLGQVISIRFEGQRMIAKVQFSARAEAIWSDVKAGIIRNVSVGYVPVSWRDTQDAKGARIRTVTRWELREVSLVPVGADPAAKVRSEMEPTTTEAPPPNASATTQSPAIETRAAVNAEIRSIATTFDLGSDWANGLIDRGATEGDARAAALSTLRTRQERRSPILPSMMTVGAHDDPTQVRSLMADAVYARIKPTFQLPEAARPFAHMSMIETARECLRMAGVSTVGLSPSEIVTRTMTNGVSDYPAVYGNVVNRTLQEAYRLAPNVLKTLARPSTAKDFRAKVKVKFADTVKLQPVTEHGRYQYQYGVDAQETYSIGTYGALFSISRQMIINDDLSVFTDIPAQLGIASAEFEADTLIGLLTQNGGNGPVMQEDNINLFAAGHGTIGAAGKLSVNALSDARLAMRRQKGMNGRPIAVTPKFLLVPPELETQAEQTLADIRPTQFSEVNPFSGKFEILVEPRLTNPTAWYVVADPGLAEGLEFSYLAGFEGPQTENRMGFEVDGMEFKVRLDFGAAFLDWRSWYLNPGQ